MQVALYFGSFNPMHIGHLAICKYLMQMDDIDLVRLVVSPQNPLKLDIQKQQGVKNLQHVRAVTSTMGNKIEVSDIEFSLSRPLFTINTLRKFSELEPYNKFVLVIGADNLSIIERWDSWRELLSEYEIWVYPRSGVDGEGLCRKYGVRFLEAQSVDVSSTQIRDGENQGLDLSSLKI